ncbi:MAG TPA: hypothetical protein VFE46_06680 [Pirellulales bacterium]|nr:hypothetical protein [Pirellulales bacterium]
MSAPPEKLDDVSAAVLEKRQQRLVDYLVASGLSSDRRMVRALGRFRRKRAGY